jgi:hypothetical protein
MARPLPLGEGDLSGLLRTPGSNVALPRENVDDVGAHGTLVFPSIRARRP